MAAGCSKSFTSKYEEEKYYDLEYEEFCKSFAFSVSIFALFSDWCGPTFPLERNWQPSFVFA